MGERTARTDGGEALRRRALADAMAERAAARLRELLREIAAAIDPFPAFPGSFFSYGIEVEPPPGAGDRGCVVLGEDGALHELRIGAAADQADTGDPAAGRSELRLPIEDGLAPAEYAAWAVRAVEAALAHAGAQAAEAEGAGRPADHGR